VLGDIGGRACVFYDQLGYGRSQHMPDAPRDFWSVDLFCRELDALLAHLGVEPLVAALPDVRWELLHGASHSTHLEQPERFVETVAPFLAAHDEAARPAPATPAPWQTSGARTARR
jgi:pimeloyl-ACP methyl ester carboxylesterase